MNSEGRPTAAGDTGRTGPFWTLSRVAGSWAVVFVVFFLVAGCGPMFFSRNPRLRLLLDEPRTSVICPTWSPDGERIYYLRGDAGTDILGFSGSLMVIAADGSSRRQLLNGDFGSLAVSPEGRSVALTVGDVLNGGRLIVVDTSGQHVDTVGPPADTVPVVEFGAREDDIYYYAQNRGVLRLNLNTLTLDTIVLADLSFHVAFAVWADSLLLWRAWLYDMATRDMQSVTETEYPRFCPLDAALFVGAVNTGSTGLNELAIVDRRTGTTEYLQAKPYYNCNISHPHWSPDGDEIVFSAADIPNADYPPTFYQLWIYRW